MITVYTVEGRDGKEVESFSTQDYEEARTYAQQHSLRVIANEHEFSDSYPVDDYTDQLTDDEEFFYDHASYHPGTSDEAHRQRARELAEAEALLNRTPAAWITWDDEDDPDTSDHQQYRATLQAESGTAPSQDQGTALASLRRLDAAPDDPYRRVIEAQLADDARDALQALNAPT
jgi:hypothetical protein